MTCAAIIEGLTHLPEPMPAERAAYIAALTECDPIASAKVWIESRGESTATSRVVNGVRLIGATGPQQPAGLQISKGLYCGIFQTQAFDWATCLAMRDDKTAWLFYRHERAEWLLQCHGNLACALGGIAGGNDMARKNNRAANYVFAIAKGLQ